MTMSLKIHDNEFLFDLSEDESENHNLLSPSTPNYNERLNAVIKSECMRKMQAFMTSDDLFSAHSAQQIDLYLNPWRAPQPIKEDPDSFCNAPYIWNRANSLCIDPRICCSDDLDLVKPYECFGFVCTEGADEEDADAVPKGANKKKLGRIEEGLVIVMAVLAVIAGIAITIKYRSSCRAGGGEDDGYQLIRDKDAEQEHRHQLPHRHRMTL